MRYFIPVFMLLFATFVSGCFPFSGQERTIVGDYELQQFDGGTPYYLHKRGVDDSSQGGSIIGGIVIKIGWSSRYILADRHAIYRGDGDGWMIIDVKTGAISGPFSDVELQARPEAKGIHIYDVSEAWKKL